MARFSRAGLRARLLLFVFVALLPALLLILYTAGEQRRMAAAGARESALSLLRQATMNYEELIVNTHQLLAVSARQPAVSSGDYGACSTFFSELVERDPSYDSFILAGPGGEVFCPQGGGPVNLLDRDYFRRVLETRGFVVGDYVISRLTGRPVLPAAYPVLDQRGEVRAVLVATISLDWLQRLAANARLPDGATLTVIDRYGTVLSRYPDAGGLAGKSLAQTPVIQDVLSRKTEGTVESTGIDGTRRLYAFMPLHSTAGGGDVYIYAGIPVKIAYAGVYRLLFGNLAGVGLATVLALVFAWLCSDLFFLRQVNALLGATRRLTAGDTGARAGPPYGPGELGQLARAFDYMAEALGQNIDRLHRAEAKYRTRSEHLQALRHIDLAITGSLDLRVTLNVVLDQVAQQLGVHAADVLLLNPHTQTLEYAAGRGFRHQGIERSRLRLGEGYGDRALFERNIIRLSSIPEAGSTFLRAPLLEGEDFVAYFAVPLIAKGQVKGLLEIFHREGLDPGREWLDFLETLAGQAAIAIDNATLFEGMQRSNIELTLAYDDTIEGWSRALDLRDKETEGHSRRVTAMSLRLARALGMEESGLVHVRRGALLHDIGKMGVPDQVLLKPGPLTEEEWAIMRRHPVYAYEMLSPVAYLRRALDIPYCHHEKWDGTGYPRGLKGEQIPFAARIFAVVDVWDALRSQRPYRAAWPEEKVLEHIREQAGKHFDPVVVEAFLEIRSEGDCTAGI